MAEPDTAAVLQACRLPQAWQGQNAWRVLETDFSGGQRFLATWRAWQDDPLRPRMLHFVSILRQPLALNALLAKATLFPPWRVLVDELADHWSGLIPGFHRLILDNGQVSLTLCIGDLTALLRQQEFAADSVYLDTVQLLDPTLIRWTVKALSQCCRRGTRLAGAADALAWQADLAQCGFEIETSASGSGKDGLSGHFNPRWTLKNRRYAACGHATAPATCAVIGAGLAGASVAAALARRGWLVRVVDQGDAPAAGASGLPVGLVVPHVSADDCPLSRLSRAGVRLMLQQARSLLQQGQDWDATGTLERQLDGAPNLPDIWHTQAAWLKPAQLVRAWLAQPGVTFQGQASVHAVRHHGGQWQLLDARGDVLACASQVVFANANGALPLIQNLQNTTPLLGIQVDHLPAMQAFRGQLSWAMHQGSPDPAFPLFPVNGAGSLVPRVPVGEGAAWYAGSSYQNDAEPALPDESQHAANLARMLALVPALRQSMTPLFASGAIQSWKNTRCVSSDRLPLVGPLNEAQPAGLWICAGMGSRGLSFSVLCAELLAARWGAEPLPIDRRLARSLMALRAGQPRVN